MKSNKKWILLAVAVVALVAAFAALMISQGDDDGKDTENPPAAAQDETKESYDELAISSEEAVYEEWLAASVVTAISLTYPDFQLEEILAASKTEMSDMKDSEGVYVKFASGGEPFVVCAKPLEKERTKAGTIDLHEEKLGFATFDLVKESALKEQELTAIDMNALSELIAESLLVSLYEHY